MYAPIVAAAARGAAPMSWPAVRFHAATPAKAAAPSVHSGEAYRWSKRMLAYSRRDSRARFTALPGFSMLTLTRSSTRMPSSPVSAHGSWYCSTSGRSVVPFLTAAALRWNVAPAEPSGTVPGHDVVEGISQDARHQEQIGRAH